MVQKMSQDTYLEFDPEVGIFFKYLWDNITMQRLFFVQKNQLFPELSDDSMNLKLPLLFLGNLPQKATKPSLDVLNVAGDLDDMRHVESREIFNDDVLTEMGDMAYYYLIKFLRKNQQLIELAQSDVFSYSEMKSKLKVFQDLNFDIFDDLDNCIRISSVDDTVASNVFSKTIDKIKQGVEHHWIDIIQSFDMSNIKGQLYLHGYRNTVDLLKTGNIKIYAYEDILAKLYSIKLIENIGSVFWCHQCLDEPFITHTTSNIHPSHHNLKCPKCSKKMYYVSAYALDEDLVEYIYDRDGLLKSAFIWQLKKEDIDIEESYYSSKYENDLVLTHNDNHFLVEIKMHNTSKDSDSIKGHFINDLSQLRKHLQTLRRDGMIIEHAFLLTNHLIKDNSNSLQKALTTMKKHEETSSMSVVDYANVNEIVDSILDTS